MKNVLRVPIQGATNNECTESKGKSDWTLRIKGWDKRNAMRARVTSTCIPLFGTSPAGNPNKEFLCFNCCTTNSPIAEPSGCKKASNVLPGGQHTVFVEGDVGD